MSVCGHGWDRRTRNSMASRSLDSPARLYRAVLLPDHQYRCPQESVLWVSVIMVEIGKRRTRWSVSYSIHLQGSAEMFCSSRAEIITVKMHCCECLWRPCNKSLLSCEKCGLWWARLVSERISQSWGPVVWRCSVVGVLFPINTKGDREQEMSSLLCIPLLAWIRNDDRWNSGKF